MKEIVLKRIEELGQEAAKLMQRRSFMEDEIKRIEERMHQISGAITELDAITRSLSSETSKIDGRETAGNAGQVGQASASSKDGV